MKHYFVVADVHSFFTIMVSALEQEGFDINNSEHIIISCGDMFDRGEESKELLDFFYTLHQQNRLILIRGNHDDLFEEMLSKGYPESHDISNGTLKTLAQLQPEPMDEYICRLRFLEAKENYDKRYKELLDSMLDYYELGDYIFVHGWLPEKPDTNDKFWIYSGKGLYDPKWREYESFMWHDARWYNGMAEWKRGIREPGKTIVCGHWHCSYGWSHIDLERKEFPTKDRPNWQDSFETWKKEDESGSIIALDACTVYSGKINVLHLMEDEL